MNTNTLDPEGLPPRGCTELTPSPLTETQFTRFLGAMESAARDTLAPAEEEQLEETLLTLEPAPLGAGREGRLASAMGKAGLRRRSLPYGYGAWGGFASACAACLALVFGVAWLAKGWSHPSSAGRDESLVQVNRQVLESREDSLRWDRASGTPYLTYNVLYQDSFYLDDDATGCVVISVPNRCRVEVPQEEII